MRIARLDLVHACPRPNELPIPPFSPGDSRRQGNFRADSQQTVTATSNWSIDSGNRRQSQGGDHGQDDTSIICRSLDRFRMWRWLAYISLQQHNSLATPPSTRILPDGVRNSVNTSRLEIHGAIPVRKDQIVNSLIRQCWSLDAQRKTDSPDQITVYCLHLSEVPTKITTEDRHRGQRRGTTEGKRGRR